MSVWLLNLSFIAAILSLKQQVEGLQGLDQFVEILIRLLCAVPGWSEKNVQVLKVLLFQVDRFIWCFLLLLLLLFFFFLGFKNYYSL